MIIEYERSGGFTAIPMHLSVDSSALEPAARENLEGLVARAHFFDLNAKIPVVAGGADRFHYKVTIQDDNRNNTVECGETNLPPELQPLIQQLNLIARTNRSGS